MQLLKSRTYRELQKEILVIKNELLRKKLPESLDSLVITSIEDFSRDVDFHTVSYLFLFYFVVNVYKYYF